MLRFLLELLPALLLGFWGGRRYPTLSGRLAMPLVRFGVPISVMGPVSYTHLTLPTIYSV